MSVMRSSSALSASIRAQSIATLPLPTTTTRSQLQVELAVRIVGMAVVPAHEVRGGLGPWQVLAGNPEPPVDRRADRIDHGVVALEQVGAMQVAPELDAPEEPEALLRRGLLVDPHDRLDLRVVRRDAGAHEPERRRQAIEQVHADGPLGGEHVPGGVEAGRSCADDRDAEFLIGVEVMGC